MRDPAARWFVAVAGGSGDLLAAGAIIHDGWVMLISRPRASRLYMLASGW